MITLGFIAAALIGISLGLMGGGGSILTVPVLVYLFSIAPQQAVTYSLFIVGLSSLVGAVQNYYKKQLQLRTALLFGITSTITVLAVRRWLLPSLPEVLGHIGPYEITQSALVMQLFAILMIAAAVSMIRNKKQQADAAGNRSPLWILFYGFLIGLVTGFLGAGGGFLLVPALVLIMKLSMKEAVGTSLLIIAMNSLTGFAAKPDMAHTDWGFLLLITAIALAGMFIGSYLNKKIDGQKLKKGFGWFVLVMGIFIMTMEWLA